MEHNSFPTKAKALSLSPPHYAIPAPFSGLFERGVISWSQAGTGLTSRFLVLWLRVDRTVVLGQGHFDYLCFSKPPHCV